MGDGFSILVLPFLIEAIVAEAVLPPLASDDQPTLDRPDQGTIITFGPTVTKAPVRNRKGAVF